MHKLSKNLLISGILSLSLTLNHTTQAYTPPYLDDVNYQKGIISLGASDYSAAILELNQAITKFPNVIEIRSNLSDAYYKRGTGFYSQKNYAKAANDFRAAIFYLKYLQTPNPVEIEKIFIIENILNNSLYNQGISTTPKNRFNEAKKLRVQGFFPHSIVEFNEASKDPSVRSLALENTADVFALMNLTQQALPYYEKAVNIDQFNKDLHLKYAKTLEKIDITDKAIEEYNMAFKDDENADEILPILERLAILNVQKYPKSASSYLNLGAVYQRKQDFASAMANYQKAKVLEPENLIIKINIGSLYQQQHNLNKAIDTYDEVIMTNPNEKLAYLYKARALTQQKNYFDAINNYKEVLRLDPKDYRAKAELIEVLSNNLPEENACTYFERMTAQFPDDLEIVNLYANSLLKKRQYYKATLQFQKLLKRDTSNPLAYINASKAYQGLYDFENAVKIIDDGITNNPDDKKLGAYKADILQNKDNMLFQQAYELYNKGDILKALETYNMIQTPNKDTYTNIAACYQKLGKYPEAFQNYSKALLEAPDDVELLTYLGNICCLQKQFEKANAYYKKALLIEPDSQTIKDAIKLANKDYNNQLLEQGMAQYKAMDYKKGLKTLTQLLSFDPQNAYGYYYRALCYDGLNDPRKAIDDYVKVTQIMPNMDIAYYSLGIDYDSIEDYKNAKETYKKFIELSGTKTTEYTKYAKQRLLNLKNQK